MAGPTGVTAAAALCLAVLVFQQQCALGISSKSDEGHIEVTAASTEGLRASFERLQAHRQNKAGQVIAKRVTINDTRQQIDHSTSSSLEGSAVIPVKHITATPISAGQGEAHDNNDDGGERKFKLHSSSCSSSGSPFEIVSSVFPLLEGCHSASADETSGGEAVYVGMTSSVSSISESDTMGRNYFWAAWYLDDAGHNSVQCRTFDDATNIHPSEGTWYCDMNSDGIFLQPMSTQFSTFCGCRSDVMTSISLAAPITVTAPILAASTTSSSNSKPPGTCTEGGSFRISSSLWPEVEGCYDANGWVNYGLVVYSIAGTEQLSYPWMFPFESDTNGEAVLLWGLVIYESAPSGEFIGYCASSNSASTHHPADVTSWWCNLTGSDYYDTLSTTAITTNCGCAVSTSTLATSTPTMQPTPPAERTPSPVRDSTAFPVPPPTGAPIVHPPTTNPIPDPTASPVPPPTNAPVVNPEPTASPIPNATPSPIPPPTNGPVANPEPTASPIPDATPSPIPPPTNAPVANAEPTASPILDPTSSLTPPPTKAPEDNPEPTASPIPDPTQHPMARLPDLPEANPEPTASPILDPTPSPMPPPATSQEIAPAPTVGAQSTTAPTKGRSIGGSNATPSPFSIATPEAPNSDATPSTSGTLEGASEFAEASCGDSDGFLITASQAPQIEGCYELLDVPSNFDGPWYSATGLLNYEQTFVLALDETSNWLIMFFQNENDSVQYCISFEDAATVHPTDATWSCDLDGDDSFEPVPVGDGLFSVNCDCGGTSDSITSTSACAPKCHVSLVVMATTALAIVAEIAVGW